MKNTENVPYMSFREIKKKYPDSWVLLLDPKPHPTGMGYYGGRPVYKHKEKMKAMEKASELPKGSFFGVAYTGEIKMPKNTVICL